MSDLLDDETLDPRSARRATARVPVLRQVYDGATCAVVDRVFALRHEVTSMGRSPDVDILLADPRVSRRHVVFRRTATGVQLENESRHGTGVGREIVDKRMLQDGDVVTVGESIFVYRLQPAFVPPLEADHALIGPSPELADVRVNIGIVAPTMATVLITGQTGVGKEVVARAIHDESGRSGAFVPVNCAAITESLAESELFGHRAGSFTGAKGDHKGYFQQAEGGTLFLDELGELPESLQPKLLRVLDDRRVQPVGGTERVAVDVRLLCATNRNLPRAVQDGTFRGDLYARVAEIPIDLPPLCDRPEDVLAIAAHALGDDSPPLSPELASALVLHEWPFNVRELFKIVTELKVRGSRHDRLELDLVEARLAAPTTMEGAAVARAVESGSVPEVGQIPAREEVVSLLTRYKGIIADVARETGRSRKQVYRWLKKYELDKDQYRDEE